MQHKIRVWPVFHRHIRCYSHSKNSKNKNITRILLTGGPCAGKTTSLAKMQNTLDGKGFRVYCVPEAATLMMKGGAILDTSQKSWDF
jgi:adenylylsulfate kinase-like enzyme